MAGPTRNDAELVEGFRDLCRASGLRATPQRIEILKEVARHGGHPSAEDVHETLRQRMPTVSLDTVYRTLALLERHGVLFKFWGPSGRCRFDANRAPHHHLVCERCGKVEDFTWPGFDALCPPEAAQGWGRVSRIQAEVRGLCGSCAATERRGTREP